MHSTIVSPTRPSSTEPVTNDAGPRRSYASGQVLVIFALLSVVIIGAVALSIDAGYLLAERRQTQSGADSGAMAAAIAAAALKPWTEASAAGVTYATNNAGADATVVINRPPTSGDHVGDNRYIEAVVTKQVTRFFVGAIYSGAWQVSARAVAGIEPIKRPYALLALHAPGIAINGTPNIYIDGAGSAMSDASITTSGNSNIVSVGGSIDANGSIQSAVGWVAPDGIRPGMPVVADPLASTPAPPTPAAPGPTFPLLGDCKTACVLAPGLYKDRGILNIQGIATLQPGIYYFSGNTTLALQNTNSTIKGSGVLLYFTGTAQFTPKLGNINLAAKIDGPIYPNGVTGLGLWIADCTAFISQGNGDFTFEGIIYAPCSHVEMHGTPGNNGLQVIVGDLAMGGTSDFHIAYRDYVKMDVPHAWLVE
jgi:hypothetical protein